MSSSPLVLVTGGNGFVGNAVLNGLLQAGYRVRAAVRRQDAIDVVSQGLPVQEYLSSGKLTFVIVPDNTKPNAYHGPTEGCSYIVHVASPLPTVPGDLVTQALAGTKAILEAAEATPTLKRIVFTASTASIRPFERLFRSHPANQALASGRGEDVPTLTAESRVPTPSPVSDDAPPFQRYTNSKIAAANLVDEYVDTHKSDNAHFSIVNIMPGWIIGPEALSRSKKEAFQGSNMVIGWLFFPVSPVLASLLGLPADEDAPTLPETVHVDDVVEAHVKALNTEKVPGQYRNFLLCSHSPTGPVMMDAADIVRRELPQEVADGKIPFASQIGTIKIKIDATPTERDLLGHPFRSFDQQVTDTIKWYVHLDD